MVSADVDEGAAVHGQRQGRAVDRALALQIEAGPTVRALAGGDGGLQPDLAALFIERNLAVANDQPVDRRQFQALSVVWPVRVQLPALAAVLGGDQHGLGTGDGHHGHLDPAYEEGAQPHRGLQVGDAQGVALPRPDRAADADLAGLDRRGPAEQLHVEVAVQLDFTLIFRRGPAPDRTAEPVPVEQHQEGHDSEDQQQGDGDGRLLGRSRAAGGGDEGVVVAPFPQTGPRRSQGAVAEGQPVRIVFQGVGQSVRLRRSLHNA